MTQEHQEEQKKIFKIASKKLGPAIGELADKIVSVRFTFDDLHRAIKRIETDLAKKNSKKKVWAVECKGDDDIYLFIASSFSEVRKKVESLPDWTNLPVMSTAVKKKKKRVS